MNKWIVCSGLCLLAFSTTALADTTDSSDAPQSGFFGGLGAGYNSVNLQQNIYAMGEGTVYDASGAAEASGIAGGNAAPYHNVQSSFAPTVQLGYFSPFSKDSSLLWGFKFGYQYIGSTASNTNVAVPQAGPYTPVSGSTTTLIGHVSIASTQSMVNHEFTFLPFIGHSYKNGFVYFGVGPALFGVEAKINDGLGYAVLNGDPHTDITGSAANTDDSMWVWGGAAQVGATYYLSPTWFIDANYTYAITGRYNINKTAPFSSTTISDGTTVVTKGMMTLNNSERITTQAMTISLNKVF